MMYELSVACKYLIPRRRQLSVSVISLISIFVIALVVCLIVVFFSVTDGLEKNWIRKLTALTAPVRLTPTKAYTQSYYSLVDTISEQGGYHAKTIGEKLQAEKSDPYDPDYDEEIPAYWPQPDLDSEGSLKDLVKLAYQAIEEVHPSVLVQEYEIAPSHIHLQLLRNHSNLSYPAFLGNYDASHQQLAQTLLNIEQADINNFFQLLLQPNHIAEENEAPFASSLAKQRIRNFVQAVPVDQLRTPANGWAIPIPLLPENARWNVCALFKGEQLLRIYVPVKSNGCQNLQATLEKTGMQTVTAALLFENGKETLQLSDNSLIPLSSHVPLLLEGGAHLQSTLDPTSIDVAHHIHNLRFQVTTNIQGHAIQGTISLKGLEIDPSQIPATSFWTTPSNPQLADDPDVGEGIILPKSFKDAGVLVGDRGTLSYYAMTASMLQEQRIPVYAAGFYDPGIIPIGGKFILVKPETTRLIGASLPNDEQSMPKNGINVRFADIKQAENVKRQILQGLHQRGIDRYWTVQTYREYEFTKEIIQELQSQKLIFMVIALVIILVACSNIISMLIILVNDKKVEIGILRSIGATSKSIAFIFGAAGAIIGFAGSFLGIIGALLLLHFLPAVIKILGQLQGHDLFSATFYGAVLPHELSLEALLFVLIATSIISLLAGLIPAIKASMIRPSESLRAAG